MQEDRHKKNLSAIGANRKLTKEQFKDMSWEEVWKRAIPIDKETFIRKHKSEKK